MRKGKGLVPDPVWEEQDGASLVMRRRDQGQESAPQKSAGPATDTSQNERQTSTSPETSRGASARNIPAIGDRGHDLSLIPREFRASAPKLTPNRGRLTKPQDTTHDRDPRAELDDTQSHGQGNQRAADNTSGNSSGGKPTQQLAPH